MFWFQETNRTNLSSAVSATALHLFSLFSSKLNPVDIVQFIRAALSTEKPGSCACFHKVPKAPCSKPAFARNVLRPDSSHWIL